MWQAIVDRDEQGQRFSAMPAWLVPSVLRVTEGARSLNAEGVPARPG